MVNHLLSLMVKLSELLRVHPSKQQMVYLLKFQMVFQCNKVVCQPLAILYHYLLYNKQQQPYKSFSLQHQRHQVFFQQLTLAQVAV